MVTEKKPILENAIEYICKQCTVGLSILFMSGLNHLQWIIYKTR